MIKLKNYIKPITLLFLCIFMLPSCEEVENDTYIFIGDSIIARWPLDETFPSRLVYNYGKSGAGISYIAESGNQFNGNSVVVMIGTNDNYYFSSDDVDSYIKIYLDAIENLTDKRIYLFSVLPREFSNDIDEINERIEIFNKKIKEKVVDYHHITYIDVFNDFMDGKHINYQYYSDGLHLNIYGYEILSSKLMQVVNK